MSYTPKTWACGDSITADDLNHIEQGIAENSGGGSTLIVNLVETDEHDCDIYDKTWQEVYDALNAGKICLFSWELVDASSAATFQSLIVSAIHDGNGYTITAWSDNDSNGILRDKYTADSAESYIKYCPVD